MEFKLDDLGYSWVADAKLASWQDYRNDFSGDRVATRAEQPGTIELVFAPEGRDAQPLTGQERALIEWFLVNEPAVSSAVKDAIWRNYPALQQSYGYSGQDWSGYMPDISSPDDLKRLIELHSVNIHQIEKGGVPYFGFGFDCRWDQEHGLGVLMHGTRMVEIGGGDTAILLWMAKSDAQTG